MLSHLTVLLLIAKHRGRPVPVSVGSARDLLILVGEGWIAADGGGEYHATAAGLNRAAEVRKGG